jgi:hypothetical protein
MTWRIHVWDAASGTGAVASAHLGPYPFGPLANLYQTPDFVVGEEVLLELDRDDHDWRVRTVTAQRQRQPANTQTPALEALNRHRHHDLFVDSRTNDSLRLCLADCSACGPNAYVTFRGVQLIKGLDDDTDLSWPWFRLASADERREHGLDVPAGAEAYCIVTNHGQGRDGPLVWIVAAAMDAEGGRSVKRADQ